MNSIKLISPIEEIETPTHEKTQSHQKLKMFKTIMVTGDSPLKKTHMKAQVNG